MLLTDQIRPVKLPKPHHLKQPFPTLVLKTNCPACFALHTPDSNEWVIIKLSRSLVTTHLFESGVLEEGKHLKHAGQTQLSFELSGAFRMHRMGVAPWASAGVVLSFCCYERRPDCQHTASGRHVEINMPQARDVAQKNTTSCSGKLTQPCPPPLPAAIVWNTQKALLPAMKPEQTTST